jgi:hypothetical protein
MIKAPSWCKEAIPTVQGWNHPKTGELLKAQKFTHHQVSDWHDALHGIGDKHDVAEVVDHHEEVLEIEEDFEEDFDLEEE